MERNLLQKIQAFELDFDRFQHLTQLDKFPKSEQMRQKLTSIACFDNDQDGIKTIIDFDMAILRFNR